MKFLGQLDNCQLLEEKRVVKLDQSLTATCTACLECNYWEEPHKYH